MNMKNIHYMKRAWSMAHYQKQSEPTTIQALFIGLKKNQFSWNENQSRQDSSLLGVFLETVVALLITNVADDNLKELLLSKIHWPDGISMKWCSSSNRLHLPHGSILHRAAGSHVLHHVYKKNWKCAMLPLLSVYTYTVLKGICLRFALIILTIW